MESTSTNGSNEQSEVAPEVKLQILEKVPSDEIKVPLDLYAKSSNLETYVRLPFLLIGVLFLIHNFFIAGNSYSYDTYDLITTVEFSIVGIIILGVFVMAGMAMSYNSKVKKNLETISSRYNIDTDIVQSEFNALAIHYYGGRGVILKKKK